MASIITAHDLNLWYGDFKALKSISLDVGEREITALIGPSGCGKSTFLKTLNRMNDLVPGVRIEGDVRLKGEDIFAREMELTDLRRRVGMVFQNPDNQIVANVVEEDVAFAPENLGVPPQEIRARVDAALKQVGMYDFRLHAPHLLSGGQKQKIALARALVHDKPIIIFDEATSNTDAYSEQQINGLLDTRLKDKTVIVITHKKEILSKVDQIVVLKEGVVADLGRYDDLIGKSDELNVMLEKAE